MVTRKTASQPQSLSACPPTPKAGSAGNPRAALPYQHRLVVLAQTDQGPSRGPLLMPVVDTPVIASVVGGARAVAAAAKAYARCVHFNVAFNDVNALLPYLSGRFVSRMITAKVVSGVLPGFDEPTDATLWWMLQDATTGTAALRAEGTVRQPRGSRTFPNRLTVWLLAQGWYHARDVQSPWGDTPYAKPALLYVKVVLPIEPAL